MIPVEWKVDQMKLEATCSCSGRLILWHGVEVEIGEPPISHEFTTSHRTSYPEFDHVMNLASSFEALAPFFGGELAVSFRVGVLWRILYAWGLINPKITTWYGKLVRLPWHILQRFRGFQLQEKIWITLDIIVQFWQWHSPVSSLISAVWGTGTFQVFQNCLQFCQ